MFVFVTELFVKCNSLFDYNINFEFNLLILIFLIFEANVCVSRRTMDGAKITINQIKKKKS